MSENKLIVSLIETFLKHYPEAEFRGGHIVLSDYNLSNDNIYFCLHELSEYDAGKTTKSNEIDETTIIFLLSLLQFPEDFRDT